MSNEDEKNAFSPMLYYFRVPPIGDMNKGFSLQQPFAVLFDNLIAVLWSIYGKDSKIKVGNYTLLLYILYYRHTVITL